jgi:hypothetical protein
VRPDRISSPMTSSAAVTMRTSLKIGLPYVAVAQPS